MTQKTIAQQLNIKEYPFEIWDKDGNQIYYECSDKYWFKSEYDSNGNRIYLEYSNGYWSKNKYDSEGRKIYYENSKREWYKREYNSNGKEIYFENSDGVMIDKRPKPSCNGKVVEIDGKKYKLTQVV